MAQDSSNVAVGPLQHAEFAAYLRQMFLAANQQFGGIHWALASLYKMYYVYNDTMARHVQIKNPSPFKRCAGFAVAFMDETTYPLLGEFDRYKFKADIQNIPRHSGAVLVYEYVKYCLHGATLDREDGKKVVLTNPISVSRHTFVDMIHALSLLSHDGAASFHLTALLFEQLAYQANKGASYELEV